MRHFFSWLRSKLILDRMFSFDGTAEDLTSNLDGLKNNKWRNGYFYSYFNKPGYYEICATFSLGTLGLGSFNGIKLHLTHTRFDEDQQQIRIFTKVRPENWFILFISVSLITSSIVIWEKSDDYLFTLGISIILFLWFNFILKIQENILMNKIKKRLRLRDK